MYTIHFSDGTVTTRDKDCDLQKELHDLRADGYVIISVIS